MSSIKQIVKLRYSALNTNAKYRVLYSYKNTQKTSSNNKKITTSQYTSYSKQIVVKKKSLSYK